MEEYVNFFWNYIEFEETIKVNVHLYSNTEDMHRARIDLTRDEHLKKLLLKKRYINDYGCFIIPPVTNKEYDILLVESETVVYDLWHEMVHVYNYYNAIKTGVNYLELYADSEYKEYDEFLARKVSTIMFFGELGRGNKKYKSQEYYNKLSESIKNYIESSELEHGAKNRYNLIQYIGFVSAVERICKNSFILPTFIQENTDILCLYNSLNKKETTINI